MLQICDVSPLTHCTFFFAHVGVSSAHQDLMGLQEDVEMKSSCKDALTQLSAL